MAQQQPLVPRSFFKNPLLRHFPSLTLPGFWEDMEEEFHELFSDQTGLTVWEDEDKNQFHIEASLPGLKPEEIEITLDKGILWIRGEKKEETTQNQKKHKFYRKAQTTFSYRLALPNNIDESREPQATYKDGVMRLDFQKTQASQTKRIQVKKG